MNNYSSQKLYKVVYLLKKKPTLNFFCLMPGYQYCQALIELINLCSACNEFSTLDLKSSLGITYSSQV